MKTLQNNFTTPEQSKRLLELGVPEDSADLYYQDYGSIPMVVWTETQPQNLIRGILKPCWSVGRLIEIFIICTPYVEIRLRTRLIEQLIASYEDVLKHGLIDFSKLEE